VIKLDSRISKFERKSRYPEDSSRQVLEVISTTREKVDFYIDPRGLSVFANDESMLDLMNGLAN
jgi:hypothetical protein